jgi:hypothetical protein
MQKNTTCSANGQRQTALLIDELSTMRETKPRTIALKTSRLLMRTELVTRLKNPARYVYDDDGGGDSFLNIFVTSSSISWY